MKTELISVGLYAFWFLSEAFAEQVRADRGQAGVGRRHMTLLGVGNVLLPLQAISLHALDIGDAPLGESLMGLGGVLMMLGAVNRWHRLRASRRISDGGTAIPNEHSTVVSEFHRLMRCAGYFGAWVAFAGLGMSLVN